MKSAREIVLEAWRLILIYRERLFWLGFVPSLLSLLVSAGYIFYQAQAFRNSPLFEEKENGFLVTLSHYLWNFLGADTLGFFSGTGFVLLILAGWILISMLCRAAIAHAIANARKGEEIQDPVGKSLEQFSPLFLVALLKRGLEPTAFFTEWSFTARNAGVSAASFASPLLIFLAILSSLSLFFLSFTTQAIIFKKKDFSKSLFFSAQLVSTHLGFCLRLLVLFFLIELRVVLNVLVVLLIPLLLLGFGGFLAHFLSPQIGFFLGGSLTVLLLFTTAYLTGILFVLSEAIWTLSFLELEEKKHEKN